MKKLSTLLSRNFAKKKINRVVAGQVALNLLKKHLKTQVGFNGKLKNNTLFLSVPTSTLKTNIYLQKQKILDQLNSDLTKRGIRIKIKDIRFQ